VSGSAPVVIIGMHRSGTSLLARMLDDMGLFVGWKLAPNHEASFFNKLNAWLLSSAGCRWDNPRPMDYLMADRSGRRLAEKYLRGRLSSLPAMEYLGPWRYVVYRSLFRIQEAWGWKDPRTTVALPIWLDIFPAARVVHVVRNGVDVADSLARRQMSGLELGRRNFKKYRTLLRYVPKRGWFGTSPRMLDRRQGFELWEEYLEFAQKFSKGLGDRYMEVCYEELLTRPREVLPEVVAFCGLNPKESVIEAAIGGVRSDRSYAFRRTPELYEFWQVVRHSRWMRHYRYDTLPDTE
jgi:hypothetical protein